MAPRKTIHPLWRYYLDEFLQVPGLVKLIYRARLSHSHRSISLVNQAFTSSASALRICSCDPSCWPAPSEPCSEDSSSSAIMSVSFIQYLMIGMTKTGPAATNCSRLAKAAQLGRPLKGYLPPSLFQT